MITYAEACRILAASVRPRPAPLLPLSEAAGAVTASAVRAELSVPGFRNAAVDGYALCAGATTAASANNPVRVPIAGLVAAGDGTRSATSGAAWEILTGAPVPAGLDAVVPLERVTRLDGQPGESPAIQISEPLRVGENIRQPGEDFVAGQVVVAAGVRLAPHHLMGLAACGVDEMPMVPAPTVAVLTTGNELATTGTALAAGQIRDANGPYLHALLPQLGARLTNMATARDREEDLSNRLRTLIGSVDIVLTTGGVSAGRLDLLPEVVRKLGGEILFHKVAIRPGKPVLFARLPDGTLLFGLPGNPLAVAVGMRFFVIPVLRALQGLPPEPESPAVTHEAVRGRGQLRFFAKAHVATDAAGCRRLRVLPGQESFRIAPLIEANCWAIVPEGIAEVPAGGTLSTLPLYPAD